MNCGLKLKISCITFTNYDEDDNSDGDDHSGNDDQLDVSCNYQQAMETLKRST